MPLILTDKLQRLVNISRNAIGTRETARLALDCFDLTSLKGNETKEDIFEICDIARHNNLASVCIYPDQIEHAKTALKNSKVVIATVINFPNGQFRTLFGDRANAGTITTDVFQAIKAGARQIDIVFPLEYFKSGTAPEMNEINAMLRACRKACTEGITMKVIFETAAFDSSDDLRHACKIAMRQNADCLKTSTGKHVAGGATMEAVAILLDEAKNNPKDVGVKISGGVKTNDDCAKFITLARGIRGHDSIRPEFFRIGASSLIDDLIIALGNKKVATRLEPSLDY